ncbi:universal stress protein [Pseudonocardia kujensis]|uniref:universal stress protein n=1 Tax=Pseudonocardia kujensis TaxID=1128675 RepID=UPI001E64A2A7|nr:universal stress protein [Pseudonocardia kujensis]MCE0765424.1 universal stress protein [Pseudonocardia kujensis]
MTLVDHGPLTGWDSLVVLLVEGTDPPGREPPDWVRNWVHGSGAALEVARGAGPGAALPGAALHRHRAVLVHRPDVASPPHRLVAAVQEYDADRPVVDAAVSAAKVCHGRLRILHAVPRSFGERSVGLAEAVDRGRRLVSTIGAAEEPGVPVGRDLVRAWPHEILDETLEADLLVVGGPRPNGPAELGLTALTAVVHAPCSVLVVPRAA